MSVEQKKSKITNILKFGVEPITVFITSLLTIAFGVSGEFFDIGTVLNKICDIGFYFSMSVLLVQILVQQYFIRVNSDMQIEKSAKIENDTKRISSVADDIKRNTSILCERIALNECVFFTRGNVQVDNFINDALHSNNAKKMKVICYGTSKFGRIIDGIMNSNILKHIELEVVICSPCITLFNNELDKPLLIQNLKDMIMTGNIKVYISNTPPTIRAGLIYDEDGNAMCCSMQPYYIFMDELRMFRGEKLTPAIFANEENRTILNELQHLFEKEFDRLSDSKSGLVTKELFCEKICMKRKQNMGEETCAGCKIITQR